MYPYSLLPSERPAPRECVRQFPSTACTRSTQRPASTSMNALSQPSIPSAICRKYRCTTAAATLPQKKVWILLAVAVVPNHPILSSRARAVGPFLSHWCLLAQRLWVKLLFDVREDMFLFRRRSSKQNMVNSTGMTSVCCLNDTTSAKSHTYELAGFTPTKSSPTSTNLKAISTSTLAASILTNSVRRSNSSNSGESVGCALDRQRRGHEKEWVWVGPKLWKRSCIQAPTNLPPSTPRASLPDMRSPEPVSRVGLRPVCCPTTYPAS